MIQSPLRELAIDQVGVIQQFQQPWQSPHRTSSNHRVSGHQPSRCVAAIQPTLSHRLGPVGVGIKNALWEFQSIPLIELPQGPTNRLLEVAEVTSMG